MRFALNADNQRVNAAYALKENVYRCPLCKEELLLRQGRIMIPHFAHKKDSDCDADTGEMTEWHINWQNRFGEENCEIPVVFNKETKCDNYWGNGWFCVPDVKLIADVIINNTVIEFQHSSITMEELEFRNHIHHSLNRRVVWLFDYQDCHSWLKRKYCYFENGHKRIKYSWTRRRDCFYAFESFPDSKHYCALYLQIGPNTILRIDESLKTDSASADFDEIIVTEMTCDEFFDDIVSGSDRLPKWVGPFSI